MPVMIWTLENKLAVRRGFAAQQQWSKANGGLLSMRRQINRPWEVAGSPYLQDVRSKWRPNVVHALKPNPSVLPFVAVVIAGIQTTRGGVLIWPLRDQLRQTQFLMQQQRPRWTGGLPVPLKTPSLTLTKAVTRSKFPAVIHILSIIPGTYFKIAGITKDSTGAALGNCVVEMFRTVDDVRLDRTTSTASGAFEFRSAGLAPNTYYLVAYKVGSPDVAGTTVNTLVGT